MANSGGKKTHFFEAAGKWLAGNSSEKSLEIPASIVGNFGKFFGSLENFLRLLENFFEIAGTLESFSGSLERWKPKFSGIAGNIFGKF